MLFLIAHVDLIPGFPIALESQPLQGSSLALSFVSIPIPLKLYRTNEVGEINEEAQMESGDLQQH